jgi:hypothetical protein
MYYVHRNMTESRSGRGVQHSVLNIIKQQNNKYDLYLNICTSIKY